MKNLFNRLFWLMAFHTFIIIIRCEGATLLFQQQQSSPPSSPPPQQQQLLSRQFEMHLRQQLQMEQQQIMQHLQLSSHRQYLLSEYFIIMQNLTNFNCKIRLFFTFFS